MVLEHLGSSLKSPLEFFYKSFDCCRAFRLLGSPLCSVMDVPSPVLPAAEMSEIRCVRRRLNVKGSPVWDPLSVGVGAQDGLWTGFEEGEFNKLDARQQYRKVYNKFIKWLSGNPQVKNTDDFSCCRELLQLAV